ncbi:MAG TPA: phenylalanine--tRNA ligase subunit beta, partial [Candidatus Paceibacterota bacterium]
EALADTLTFHVAEIEEVKGDLIDVNVLPDRAAYLLSHRGVAKELATALTIPLTADPLAQELPELPESDRLTVSLDAEGKCLRYIGALVTGVEVGPSPAWLREALESVGQRSINNVVDATNYVMLNIGQPLHAFDADRLEAREGRYAIAVRGAKEGESFTSLTGETYALPEGTLLITDGQSDAVLGLAGVKGGKHAEVSEATTTLLIEAANFDGTLVRKTAQRLKLFTDASSRFQNKPSPALAAYGMRDVLALIQEIAGGTCVAAVDAYPERPEPTTATVSLARLNAVLGASFTADDVRGALARLGFSYTEVEDGFTVLVPFERKDLQIAEDLVEEIGRTLGYDQITPLMLPVPGSAPELARFRGIERVKDFLIDLGYTELSTPSFAAEGEIALANPLQEDRPYLRASLVANLKEALTRGASVAPRVLGPESFVRLFEIGTVFTKKGEHLILSMGVVPTAGKPARAAEALTQDVMALEQELLHTPSIARYSQDGQVMELDLGKLNLEKLGEDYAPRSVRMGAYRPFSAYPFALRDIAVWTPEGTAESEVANAIVKEAGDLLVRIDLFDRFEKEGRTSFAFRLVFESQERTLSDADLDPAMERMTEALNAREGWEVR